MQVWIPGVSSVGYGIRTIFSHCFFDCEPIHEILYYVKQIFFPDQTDPEAFKYAYWYGRYSESTGKTNQLITLNFWDIFRYTIFKLKVRRILPNPVMVRRTACFIFKTTLLNSKYIKDHLDSSADWAPFLRAIG
jgi:hypothetical protein